MHHYVNMLRLLKRARMNGIKFHRTKFLGHTQTSEGMKIDDRKVKAIKNMSAPKDKKGLPSFQGMINYLKPYSVQLIKLAEPLKPLVREDVELTRVPPTKMHLTRSKKSSPILQYSRISTPSLNMLFRRMLR